MKVLKPEDRLIVWRLDRLDRDQVRCINVVEWCRQHTIHLFNLEHGLQYLDPRQPINRFLLIVAAALGGLENDRKTEASVVAKKYLISNKLYRHGMPIPGFRRYWKERPKKAPGRYYRHDEAERQVIREFVRQKLEFGVRTIDILHDLKKRGVRTAEGKRWSRWRVEAVTNWWQGCLERGLEPWVDCIPHTFDPPMGVD